MFKKKKITDFIPFRKGVRKGIAVFLLITIFSFIFIVPSSAIGVNNPDLVYENFNLYVVEMTLLRYSDLQEIPVTISANNVISQNGDKLRIDVRTTDGSTFWADYYYIRTYMDVENTVFLENENFIDVTFDFSIPLSVAVGRNAPDFFYGNRLAFGTGGNTEKAKSYLTQDDTYNYFHFDYLNGEPGVAYNKYFSQIYFYFVNSGHDSFSFYLENVDFKIVTPEEKSSQKIINNQNENTDKIIDGITDNQDKNTQAIIDNEKEMQEDEKNKSESTIMGGLDESLNNAPPDYSENIIGAFQSIYDKISHTDTVCEIDVPSITVPELNFPSAEISSVGKIFGNKMMERKVFDLGTIIISSTENDKNICFQYGDYKKENLLPELILILVKSIFSVGLTLFCLRELYGILEYIFTLKGSGGS